jgi:transposase
MKVEVTAGQVSDYKGYDLLVDKDLAAADTLLADRGYDSDHIREDTIRRGGEPVIPGRANRTKPIPLDALLYATRNIIERCINKLKCSRRTATRYDKTAASYLGFLHIAATRLWFRSLST